MILLRLSIVAAAVALGLAWHSASGTVYAAALGGAAWGAVSGVRAGLGHKPTKTDRLIEALGAMIGFEVVKEIRKHRENDQ